jgi:hypothetical protein
MSPKSFEFLLPPARMASLAVAVLLAALQGCKTVELATTDRVAPKAQSVPTAQTAKLLPVNSRTIGLRPTADQLSAIVAVVADIPKSETPAMREIRQESAAVQQHAIAVISCALRGAPPLRFDARYTLGALTVPNVTWDMQHPMACFDVIRVWRFSMIASSEIHFCADFQSSLTNEAKTRGMKMSNREGRWLLTDASDGDTCGMR